MEERNLTLAGNATPSFQHVARRYNRSYSYKGILYLICKILENWIGHNPSEFHDLQISGCSTGAT
jgi:hypothetical protein